MLIWQSYKRYDVNKVPQDCFKYLKICQFDSLIPDKNGSKNPFTYRILVPFIVKSVHWLPPYPGIINSDLSFTQKHFFFHFKCVNYFFILFFFSQTLGLGSGNGGRIISFAYIIILHYIAFLYSMYENLFIKENS